jgi:hypothetical protein
MLCAGESVVEKSGRGGAGCAGAEADALPGREGGTDMIYDMICSEIATSCCKEQKKKKDTRAGDDEPNVVAV